MKYIQLFLFFVTFSSIISCNSNQTKQISDSKEYQAYLEIDTNTKLQSAKEELNFWLSKLEKTPNQYPYYSKIATANSQIFQLTGDINQLKIAEENLLKLNKKTNFNNAGYLRSLARNYISQHRFKEALELLIKAEYNGEKLQQTHLMFIDVYLELGNINKVEKYLSKVKNFKDFDYLIRLSKYNDHIGSLDQQHQSPYAVMGILIGEKSWRGKGVAQEIIPATLTYLKTALQIERVYLGVTQANEIAINAYKKIGFVLTNPSIFIR